MGKVFSDYFSSSYREARAKFLNLAQAKDFPVLSFVHPDHKGALGEDLAIDVVRLGPAHASSAIVVTSGVHGAEGFCGSGCQLALLNDEEMLGRIVRAGLSVFLIHAVNPYGFSHLRRVNENSIDLNRNFLDYNKPLPVNLGYAKAHPLVVPNEWPPTAKNAADVSAFIAEHGPRQFQNVVSTGQSTHPDGLFFSGTAPSWSNLTLRAVLNEQLRNATTIAWMDIHTGLGPTGHGEKIYAGRDDSAELARARACWGADVVSPFTGDSFSEAVRGSATTCIYQECPQASTMAIALEYGTLDFSAVMTAIRADQWLTNNPQATAEQHASIKQSLRDAFLVDTPEWRGMVYAQTRVAVLQAVLTLSAVKT